MLRYQTQRGTGPLLIHRSTCVLRNLPISSLSRGAGFYVWGMGRRRWVKLALRQQSSYVRETLIKSVPVLGAAGAVGCASSSSKAPVPALRLATPPLCAAQTPVCVCVCARAWMPFLRLDASSPVCTDINSLLTPPRGYPLPPTSRVQEILTPTSRVLWNLAWFRPQP